MRLEREQISSVDEGIGIRTESLCGSREGGCGERGGSEERAARGQGVSL